jgi:4-amino-4-deoxy-L-arabinose transferase-like glycosyltransferase
MIFILLLAAFLRFYQIEEKTSFLGEQGRDLLIAKDILFFKKLTLLGPPTSLSPNIHFGPFYHYFNAFWLAVFKLDPLGPAIGFGFLSLLGCLFLYLTAKNFGFKKAGLLASFLFAVSPLMVRYGQSMFNSYFLVSFTIFSFWAISEFWRKKKRLWLLLAGLLAGIAVQANFLSYGLPICILILLLFLKKDWLKNTVWFIGGILFGILPYLVFELKHAFFNTYGFIGWLANPGSKETTSFFGLNLPQIFFKTLYYPLGNQNNLLAAILVILTLASFAFFLLRKKKDDFFKIIWLFWLVNIILVGVYKGEMLDHYLGTIYPFVFLWFGYLFERMISFKSKRGFLFLIGFLLLIALQLSQFKFKSSNGLGMPAGWNMKATKESAKIIAKDSSGKFNVANLLDGDTRAYAYRYLLSLAGKEPLDVEAYPNAEVLYVLTRVGENDVLTYPVWEIYSLGSTRIEKNWPIKDDVKIFKLIKK